MPDDRKPYRRPARPTRGFSSKRPREGEKEFPGERLAKRMARAGIASRRDAEDLITAGRVSVNGKIVDSPALNVGDEDEVLVDGKPLPEPERTRLFLYHKPRGRITTARDPEGRPTVFDDLPPDLPRLLAVGRLDFNTEGLLLLTNDGGLKRLLELPSTGWLRRYRVRAFGRADQAALAALAEGVEIEGISYGPVEAQIERQQGDNVWLALGLREGKNREVRIILQHLGLEVNRLIRVSYGPFQLGEIEEGQVMEIPRRRLRDQLGERLANEAGVDFNGPVHRREQHPRPAPLETPRRHRDDRDGERPQRRKHDEGGREGRFAGRALLPSRDRARADDRPFAGRATGKAERFANLQERGEPTPVRERKPRHEREAMTRVEHDPSTGKITGRLKTIADRKGRDIVVRRKSFADEAGEETRRHVTKRPFRELPRDARPRPERDERGERGERGDRRPRPAFKSGPRGERRSEEGAERPRPSRPPRQDRPEGRERFQRAERPGRDDRFRQGERRDGPNRERGERSDRPSFRAKPRFERGNEAGGERPWQSRPRREGGGDHEGREPGDRPERASFRSRPRFDRKDEAGAERPWKPRPRRDEDRDRESGERGDRPARSSFRSKPRFERRDGDGPDRSRRDGSREDGPRQDRPYRDRPRQDGPRQDGSRQDGPRRDGPRRDGPRRDGPRRDGPPQDRPRGDGRRPSPPRGPRPPRRG